MAMRWERERIAIELTDEPAYTFGSADNAHAYAHAYLLEPESRASSTRGVRCFVDGQPRGSVVLGASGGHTGVHEHSCVVLVDRCLVAVGDRVAALALPDLALLWQARVGDEVTCFGLHVAPDEQHVVVHGELSICLLTLEGQTRWVFTGADIFTGACAVRGGHVVVSDFDAAEYWIDLKSGRRKIVGAD